jgi:hypothetical protein
MTDTDPVPYGYDQPSGPGYQPPSQGRAHQRPRNGSSVRRTALIIHTIADVAAGFLALWIVLYMFDANQANVFVQFVKGVADPLAWWSQDIFTMNTERLRVLLNYGLPAVLYLAVGHGIAARMRRL